MPFGNLLGSIFQRFWVPKSFQEGFQYRKPFFWKNGVSSTRNAYFVNGPSKRKRNKMKTNIKTNTKTKQNTNESQDDRLIKQIPRDTKINTLIDVVMVGNWLAHSMNFGFSGHRSGKLLSNEVRERLSLENEQLDFFKEETRESFKDIKNFLKLIERSVV